MNSSESARSVASPGLRLCLAASGGGHIRQLLDLEPAWAGYDRFMVTEDTALGRSIAEEQRTYFVPHFAVGQARLGAPLKMLAGAWRSVVASRRFIARERPDVVITTGAGAVFPAVLWAWLYGARVILIDSFARFHRPSLFARITAPIAKWRFGQSMGLARWGYEIFDPLRIEDHPRPPKQRLLFATVGATLPFDRLIDAVADLKARGDLPERVIAQVGIGGRRPEGIETVETLPFDEVKALLRDADFVVCHGGTGSLVTALREGCRTIAIPRRFDRGEHYDDHQAEITGAFARRGMIAVADDANSLAVAIAERRLSEPVVATTDPSALNRKLTEILSGWAAGRDHAAQSST